jgi:plastocyanin
MRLCMTLAIGFVFGASIAMAACSQAPEPASPDLGMGEAKPTCKPHGTELEIAVLASASHLFTKDCLAAPAGEPFTIYFNNQDTSSHGNHNIHIVLPDEDFVGYVALHGTDATYEVGPIPTGTYEFHCDQHLEMKGTFVVALASSPAAGETS